VTATARVSLDESYARCRRLARRHGRSYYVATWLLPPEKRHHVHALYGFCRHADDIVDDLGPAPAPLRRSALEDLGARFFAGLAAGRSDDPVLAAVVDTVRTFAIEPECFERFLAAMAMDLTVSRYDEFGDLLRYMDGSAAAIGEMLLPILEPSAGEAREPARQLGIAFQLTNFLRDVGEDLRRDRVYLPQADIARFEAAEALTTRRVTPAWEGLMRFEIERARQYYAAAECGIALLPPASARCVTAARLLYARILDQVEANGYDVFSRRAGVPTATKLATVGQLAASGLAGSLVPSIAAAGSRRDRPA
jgi:15-cis-phytoene synthase